MSCPASQAVGMRGLRRPQYSRSVARGAQISSQSSGWNVRAAPSFHTLDGSN